MPFPAYLSQHGMIPGIKVDTGAKPLAGFPGETITEGLDGLRERLAEYHKLGARFAKWRAVIDIGWGFPRPIAIEANAHALARYAALCQEAGIVPIVEPEVLMDGATSASSAARKSRTPSGRACSTSCSPHRIVLEGMVLKPNMVISGKKRPRNRAPEQVAEATLRTLKRHVPLGGAGHRVPVGRPEPGRGDAAPVADERRMGPLPWAFTFSYGRALQDTSLQAPGPGCRGLRGRTAAVAPGAKLNGLAAAGRYKPAMESPAA